MRYLEFGKELRVGLPLSSSEIIWKIIWDSDKLILVKQKAYCHFDDVILGPNDVTKHHFGNISRFEQVSEVVFRYFGLKSSLIKPAQT